MKPVGASKGDFTMLLGERAYHELQRNLEEMVLFGKPSRSKEYYLTKFEIAIGQETTAGTGRPEMEKAPRKPWDTLGKTL